MWEVGRGPESVWVWTWKRDAEGERHAPIPISLSIHTSVPTLTPFPSDSKTHSPLLATFGQFILWPIVWNDLSGNSLKGSGYDIPLNSFFISAKVTHTHRLVE